MDEKILLDVEFNSEEVAAAIRNISAAKKAIDELKAANMALAKQGDKNSAVFVENEEEIKSLSSTISQNSKVVQASIQAQKNQEKAIDDTVESIDSLRKANSALLKERNGLNLQTVEGTSRLKEINDQVDLNNEKIKVNSSRLEQQKINIGNYGSALDSIVPGLGKFASGLQSAAGGSGGLVGGLQAATKASLAFIATPIGAILAALVAAFALLKTFIAGSTDGMDKFEDATTAVSTVLNVIVDRVVSLVKGIGALLSGDIIGGLKQINNSFVGIGDEIEREVGLAVELNSALRDLEDAEINYEIATSKTANEIKKLVLESKNRTLSEEERIKKLEQAGELEKKQTEELNRIKLESLRISNEQALLQNEVRDAVEANGAILRKAGESEVDYQTRLGQAIIDTQKVLDEARDKIKEDIIAVNDAQGQSLAFQEKLQNQADALRDKQEAEAEKRAEKERAAREKREAEILKAAENEAKAAYDLQVFRLEQEALIAKSVEDRVKKELELAELKRNELLRQEDLTQSQVLLITAQYEAEVTAIHQKGITDRAAADKADNEAAAAQVQADLDRRIAQGQAELQQAIQVEKDKLLAGLITRQEYEEQLAEMELAMLEAKQAIIAQFGEDDVKLQSDITDRKIAIKNYETQQEVALERSKAQAIGQILSQAASLVNKNTLAYKALAIAQATMNTYQGATLALATYPPPFGAIAAALTVLQGFASVKNIATTNVPKLAKGGIIKINGKSHSQGGEDVVIGGRKVANVEGNEHIVVLNKNATGALNALGNYNQMTGGINFGADRAPRRRLEDGGIVARNVQGQIDSQNNEAIKDMVVEAVKAVTIVAKIDEINKTNAKLEKAITISELS